MSIDNLVASVRKGDRRSASQIMSMVERATPEGEACLKLLRQGTGQAQTIGVTGWPGVGKSTLIGRIAGCFLAAGKRVGIIAVDPTSPVSGGSFLGDRERMRAIDGHEHLFIRSMATRGYPGGIGAATDAFVRIMEAMGKDVILVETVGVGQDQVSVSQVVDTVVMTVIPGMGDYLQALKAGVMELGDIFVVNKADRTGIEEAVMDLKMILGMNDWRNDWTPPIVKTIAMNNDGIPDLMSELERHRVYCARYGVASAKRIAAAKQEILETLRIRLFDFIGQRLDFERVLEQYARQILAGTIDRHALVDTIFREIGIGV